MTAHPPYSYAWTPVGGTGATATGLSGDTNYTVTVTNTNGCTTTAQVILTAPAQLLASMSGDANICTGDSTTLFVDATGGTAPYTYAWLPSGVGPSNIFSPTDTTTYYVTVTDSNGCSTSASYFVDINPPPVVNFSDSVNGCEPLKVLFSNLTPNSANCIWDVGEGNDTTTCDPFTHTYNDAGNYDVTLTVTDVNGCNVSKTQTNYINVYAAPAADFTAFPWIASTLSSTIIFTDQSLLANYWIWNFSGLDTSTLQDPVFIFPNDVPGMYRVELEVSTSYGCIDSITKTVTIEGAFIFFVPNAFSPNKDGVNDEFFPIGTGINWDKIYFWIYNRWGEEIYYTESKTPWDGKDNNSTAIVQQGVYVWVVVVKDINGKTHRSIGHVTLMR